MSNNVAGGAVRVALIALLTAALLAADANAQVSQTAIPRPNASLTKHCDDISDVFKLARFKGEYRQRVDAFVASKCVGEVPIPRPGDSYNIQRFNTSAGILITGGINIAPN